MNYWKLLSIMILCCTVSIQNYAESDPVHENCSYMEKGPFMGPRGHMGKRGRRGPQGRRGPRGRPGRGRRGRRGRTGPAGPLSQGAYAYAWLRTSEAPISVGNGAVRFDQLGEISVDVTYDPLLGQFIVNRAGMYYIGFFFKAFHDFEPTDAYEPVVLEIRRNGFAITNSMIIDIQALLETGKYVAKQSGEVIDEFEVGDIITLHVVDGAGFVYQTYDPLSVSPTDIGASLTMHWIGGLS